MAGYLGLKPLTQAAYDRPTPITGVTGTTLNFAYNPNFLQVFKNGVLLTPADYTANDGISIVFTKALVVTDVVEFIGLSTFTTADTYSTAQTDLKFTSTYTSMSAMLLDSASFQNDQIVYLEAFHAGFPTGIHYKVNTTGDLTTHDGGTYIDVTNAADLITWDAAAQTTWFTAGTGTGILLEAVNPPKSSSTFGAKPNTDASKSIQKCIDVFDYVSDKDDYILGATINITKSSIVMNEKKYYIDSDISGISYTGSPTLTSTVSSINDTPDTSILGYTDTSTRVTVTTITGFAVGDKVVLTGDAGQALFSSIYFISGNIVYLTDKLTYTIGTNPTLSKYDDCNFIIKGNFEYRIATTTPASFAVKLARNVGGTVKSCNFNATGSNLTNSISTSGFETNIFKNTMHNVEFGIDVFDGDKNSIYNNRLNFFTQGIRLVRGRANTVHNNFITNGKDLSYSVGIELTGETVAYDKNCFNTISENKVFNANHGVAGSGIGGIHLNFKAFNNIVKDNTSQRNSFGIYLENSCSYNTISGNNCSYNDGYYGVGIELDWDAEYNTITDNVCNYNVGSQTAAESAGIEIRGTVASGHASRGNIVSNNECNFNGLYGIWANGIELTITGNSCRDNGSLVELLDIGTGIKSEADSLVVTNNNILQNYFDSRLTSAFVQIGLDIDTSKDIVISGNNINCGYYTKHAVKLNGVNNKAIIETNNIVYDGAADRGFVCYGIDAVSVASQIHVRNNTFDFVSNGTPDVEFTFTDSLSLWGNIYPRSKSISLDATATAGRITPVDD